MDEGAFWRIRHLTIIVIPPAGKRAVASNAAGVNCSRADLVECTCWHVRHLEISVIPPADKIAIVFNTASVPCTCADLGVGAT